MQLDNKKVYLLLGSNLGDRRKLIDEAILEIGAQVGAVFQQSSFYETAAWGREDQPGFLNVAIGVVTAFNPMEVLEKVLRIEQDLGRVRLEKWGSRLIDIDLILFDDLIVDEGPVLQIPHPQMQHRKFVLEPLAELIPHYKHPLLQQTIQELLESLDDNLAVSKI
ncbi:2-amino-4-hydroxy-6-hydroxymethyldihydropteridine diphosphokinase [Pedobacter sp. MC2016-24]|uniref:2-amino-4-hydroxy-6- hydroxymethyldihydropteridine diphosphokinase n=1 Tax=Pedobacter sp. MC2016-24 TaxID=2780090 RepID=UPI001882A86D|nr:2-amino-4-hydroxy-6-hydroxymethyldihydropteridine diphosphokinase [Pedobacter sp. MC2016-24]MBE9602743.1 2-amino-4-hydroxy-6-hydroxymethyldihydropteridine diphosphokinase [Pedobacter sp. MC2016-24]